MELTEYQNLIKFISSGFIDFPEDLADRSTKKGRNQREYYKRRAEKTYFVNGDRLYRFSPGNAQGVEVVQDGQQMQVLKEFHSSPFGGHSGVNKTISAIQKRYWWSGLTEDVKNFIRSCEKCQRSDPLRPPQRPELHTIQVSHPFELVGVDLMGPFVESSQGNKYIFTATDYYTKWVEAFPIPNKSATVVSKCFEKMFSRHGAMNAIITDQGREFINEINSKLCEAWNIEHRVAAAYHPQTNGLDERTNQTIKTALRKLTNEDQTDWDQHLDAVLFSLRTKSQYTTKYSPFFLLYGREAIYPSKLPKNFKVLEEVKRTFSSGQHAYWIDSCPVFSFWSEVTKEEDEATLVFAQELLKLLKHLPMDLRKKTSTVMIMAGICSMAMKKTLPVLTVTTTLKLKPSHMEVVEEATGPLRKVKVAGEVLEEGDFKTLDEGQWLNDKIMNAFLALLRMRQNEGDTHVFVIPSYAAVLWAAGNLEHWLFRRVQFSLFKLILMPINVNENHWVLLVTNVKEKTVTVMDSMNGKDGQRYAGIWRKFMKKRDDAIEEKLGDWCIVQTSCNQQKDGSSCGVFALMNAECVIKDVPHDVMRQVHVRGYRQYIKNRLLIAASQNTTDKCDATSCKGKRAGKRSIQCTVCGRWMHIKCVDMTARAARDIPEYVCLICEAMYS